MKKTGLFFVPAIIAALLACVITSCGDDGEYVNISWEPNEKVIEALRTTSIPIVYKSTGQPKNFDRVKGNKWEEYKIPPELWTTVYIIITGFGPDRIVFKEGKVYCTPWTSYGYKCFGEEERSEVIRTINYLWGCHQNKIQHWQNFYFEFDFDYDKSNRTLLLGNNEYGVVTCESNNMSLSSLGDDHRTIEYYESDLTDNANELLVFDDYIEIYQYKLSHLREIYGNTFTDEYYNNLAPEQSWSKEYNLIELEQQFNDEIANNNKTQ